MCMFKKKKHPYPLKSVYTGSPITNLSRSANPGMSPSYECGGKRKTSAFRGGK